VHKVQVACGDSTTDGKHEGPAQAWELEQATITTRIGFIMSFFSDVFAGASIANLDKAALAASWRSCWSSGLAQGDRAFEVMRSFSRVPARRFICNHVPPITAPTDH
jgi:hypothetical protein